MSGAPWTDTMNRALTAGWFAGLSSTEIALLVGGGISASAVRGRRIEMGLPDRPQGTTMTLGQHNRGYHPPPVVKSKPLPPTANALAPGSQPKPFVERGRFECAFPIGDGDAMRACCCTYEPGRRRPYCDFHLGLTTDVERVSA